MTSAEFRIYPIIGRLDFPNQDKFRVTWFNPVTGRRIGQLEYELRPTELRRARRHIEEARITHLDPLRIPWCPLLTGRKARWKWPEVARRRGKGAQDRPAPGGIEAAGPPAAGAASPPESPAKP